MRQVAKLLSVVLLVVFEHKVNRVRRVFVKVLNVTLGPNGDVKLALMLLVDVNYDRAIRPSFDALGEQPASRRAWAPGDNAADEDRQWAERVRAPVWNHGGRMMELTVEALKATKFRGPPKLDQAHRSSTS